MGQELMIWLANRPNVGEVLRSLGWVPREDHFERRGRSWFANAFGPRRLLSEDAPEEARVLVPGISWLVEISMEGNSSAGRQAVTRAATALARAAHGAISSDEEDRVWAPNGVRRIRTHRTCSWLEFLFLYLC